MAYPYQRITSDDDLLRSKKSPAAAPTVFSDENAYARSIARGFTTPSNSVVQKPDFSNVAARSGTLRDFTNVQGGVRSTEFPDFSNVEGGVSATVPDKGSTLARRAAPQVSTPGAYGYAAPNVGNPDDRERKAALSSLDSTLFGLGSLNMRSKRELFGQLLGMKQDLTKTAFNADNERVQLRAKIGADAAEGNARLAESAAQRRSSADMFNAESSEKRDMFDTERNDRREAAAAAAAAANDPNTLENRLKLAKENRDQQTFEAGLPAKLNAVDNAEIESLMKNEGMTRAAAENRILERRLVNGENVRGSRASTSAYDTQLANIENALNDTGVNMWATRALAGDGYAPFDYGQMEPLKDFTQTQVEQLGALNPVRLFTSYNNRVKATGADGKEFTTYANDETAADLRRKIALQRRGGR